jgi:hypothetical protein
MLPIAVTVLVIAEVLLHPAAIDCGAIGIVTEAMMANQPLHLTAAALRFFEVQRLTSRRGR